MKSAKIIELQETVQSLGHKNNRRDVTSSQQSVYSIIFWIDNVCLQNVENVKLNMSEFHRGETESRPLPLFSFFSLKMICVMDWDINGNYKGNNVSSSKYSKYLTGKPIRFPNVLHLPKKNPYPNLHPK